MRIVHNKFKAINLYRLRHMQGLRYDALQDQERIGIEDGNVTIKKDFWVIQGFWKVFYGYLERSIPQL